MDHTTESDKTEGGTLTSTPDVTTSSDRSEQNETTGKGIDQRRQIPRARVSPNISDVLSSRSLPRPLVPGTISERESERERRPSFEVDVGHTRTRPRMPFTGHLTHMPDRISGDFDRDRLPHFGGGLRGSDGTGSLMGPDHPIFGGGNRQMTQPGRIPGARFDPFGPGVGGRHPRRPPRGYYPPGPSPDHLRPPSWHDGGNDDGPPPGMFF